MRSSSVQFSIASVAAWAPGVETEAAWQAWARGEVAIQEHGQPKLLAMPPMQRRRLGALGKMALEVAYACLGERHSVPSIFCSRHGEVSRSVDLLQDLAGSQPISPTSFGLSVHNAVGGMFSIAREDQANHLALSAGESSVEHAVIEACGLLADGEKAVLLVVYDCPLPEPYACFQDVPEQPFAWAWLIVPAQQDALTLSWSASLSDNKKQERDASMSGALEVLRFSLGQGAMLERQATARSWRWSRDA